MMKNLSGNIKKHRQETDAALTVEAALGVTIFMFMVILLIMPMKMLNTQRQVQSVLEAASKQLSQYAYIPYRLSRGDGEPVERSRNMGEDAAEMTEAGTAGIFEKGALSAYLSAKIYGAVGKKIEGLDFSKLRLEEEGEVIDLYVTYRLKLPFSIFRLDSVPASSRSLRRGYIGSEGGRRELGRDGTEGEEELVYVGNNMGRYHRLRDCHYISNKISAVSLDSIKSQVSAGGSRYKPCGVCQKRSGFGSQVYIMPNGAYYHGVKNCSSIAYYVRQVPLSQVIHLGECSYCGKRKD